MACLRDRFSFGEVVHEGEIRTYMARNRHSGTPVLIHLFAISASHLEQLLDALRDSSGQTRPPVLEVGHDQGNFYSITQIRPELTNFAAWLRNIGPEPQARADDALLKQRLWKLPHVNVESGTRSARPDVSPTSPPAPAQDFSVSGLFGTPSGPSDSAVRTRIFPASVQRPGPTGSRVPDQLAQSSAENPECLEAVLPASSAPDASPTHETQAPIPPATRAKTEEPHLTEPGEFTRVFQSAPGPPGESLSSFEPSEFTRLFNVRAGVPDSTNAPSPDVTEAVEGSPSAAPKFEDEPNRIEPSQPEASTVATPSSGPHLVSRTSVLPARSSEPGEFTRVFSASPDALQPPTKQPSSTFATGNIEASSVPDTTSNVASSQLQTAPTETATDASSTPQTRISPPSSTSACRFDPGEFTQIFNSPVGTSYTNSAPEAAIATRVFHSPSDDVHAIGAKTSQPPEGAEAGEATNLFNNPAQPSSASKVPQGQKLTPHLISPAFSGTTLHPPQSTNLSAAGSSNVGGNSANLEALVSEIPGGPNGATHVFEVSPRYQTANPGEGQSEYTRLFRPLPDKSAGPSEASEAPALPRKEVPVAFILTLVLLFLTGLALILFFGFKR